MHLSIIVTYKRISRQVWSRLSSCSQNHWDHWDHWPWTICYQGKRHERTSNADEKWYKTACESPINIQGKLQRFIEKAKKTSIGMTLYMFTLDEMTRNNIAKRSCRSHNMHTRWLRPAAKRMSLRREIVSLRKCLSSLSFCPRSHSRNMIWKKTSNVRKLSKTTHNIQKREY